MKKIFGGKNILLLIFGLIMMLPFFSILSRVIYVQSNPNAYESYSGTSVQYQKQLKYQTNDVNTLDDFVEGNIYYFTTYNSINEEYIFDFVDDGDFIDLYFSSDFTYFFPSLVLDDMDISISTISNSYSTGLSFQFYYDWDYYQLTTSFYNSEHGYIDLFFVFDLETEGYCTFIFDDNNNLNVSDNFIARFISACPQEYIPFEYVEIASSTLDNVFDYSLASFIEDNNFGIDFFQWFDDTFLNQSGHNMIYLNFANWYLNYAMIVSTAYILFLAMIWFVYFARSLFEKFMNHEGGGF